jgi:hypothetical protein
MILTWPTAAPSGTSAKATSRPDLRYCLLTLTLTKRSKPGEPFRRIQIVDHGSTASTRSSRMVQIDAIRYGRKVVKQRLIWFATVPRQRMVRVVRYAADALSHTGRVWISSLIRFIRAMQSIFACRSV